MSVDIQELQTSRKEYLEQVADAFDLEAGEDYNRVNERVLLPGLRKIAAEVSE
ncbi:MAG: hypothetical protein ABEI97_04575 [Candidatus Nanohaloarchaea archaeon]